MAAISDNKYDVHDWIVKIIDSCESYFHYEKVHALIENFNDMHRDWRLSASLRCYANDQYDNMIDNSISGL